MNYCQGSLGGRHAFIQAASAIAEGRLDVALVGGADSLIGAEDLLSKPCAEGGSFALLSASSSDLELDESRINQWLNQQPEVGAASWSIALWKYWEQQK